MDAIVNKARTEGPTVTIIAGDLFNRSRVWADTALDDVNDAISRFIVPLCEYSDAVVLLFGTMNHDNPRAFEVIRKATPDLKNLYIYTEPRVERLVTSEGPVQIIAVPGFDKARLRLFCPGADKETENRNATALVNDIILGLATELDRSLPSILTAHYTVSGSEADNGQHVPCWTGCGGPPGYHRRGGRGPGLLRPHPQAPASQLHHTGLLLREREPAHFQR